MIRSQFLLLVAGLFARQCVAQESGWQPGQVNATMCYWDSPRAAVIRDTLYIDGGYLWWLPGMEDGSYSPPTQDGNPFGLVYLLNFSTPFDTTRAQNFSNVFTTVSKAAGGAGAQANNIGPQYWDGTMFANDYDWITYGGLLSLTDAFKAPAADSIAAYQKYPQGPKQLTAGYVLDQLPAGVTRYVSNGAGVSVPSENLGFYFSGLRAASSGPIFYQPGPSNSSIIANVTSQTLIEVDMSTQGQENWSNTTLPTSVPGRANAELVWIPVSKQGVLVAMGGVVDPSFATESLSLNPSQTNESKSQSPGFMSTVDVYDIAEQKWYRQPTTGAPGQLTQGCAVLASAQDGSSHNIYWYGGYDGLDQSDTFLDDVWILSIPSFMWMKVYSGNAAHARAGHRCTKPYPDQMFVIGGYSSLPSDGPPQCVDGNIVQIFNLSSGTWIDSYDPTKWSDYTVPPMISSMIGGTGTGSATQTAPSPSGFANASMTALFGSAYNSSKLATWYPYTPSPTSTTNRTTILPTPVSKPSGTPAYLAPVLGVVLGLFFITLLILAFLLWRRRKFLKSNPSGTQSEAGTMDNRRWVTSWLRSTPADAKAPTVTTDETPSSPYEEDVSTVPEMADSQVHELPDTSQPTELHAHTGMVPLSSTTKTPRNAIGVTKSPSAASHASQTSSISHLSQTSRPGISPVHPLRADSPSLGSANRERVGSQVSVVSDSERGHLRGISDTSVSTEATMPMEGTGARGEGRPGAVSPLGGEYLGASGSGSAGGGKRKSFFEERLDER